MKIVFPSDAPDGLLSKRGAHFGRAKFYTVVEMNENSEIIDIEAIPNAGHHAGGCANAVMNIQTLGADALVVSGIGGSPLQGFIKCGITVYHDTVSATVSDSVQLLIAERLHPMRLDMSCSHH